MKKTDKEYKNISQEAKRFGLKLPHHNTVKKMIRTDTKQSKKNEGS